jgi:hypothetical protein
LEVSRRLGTVHHQLWRSLHRAGCHQGISFGHWEMMEDPD